MADGRLIIEIYEYRDDSPEVPPFEFIPCSLDTCMKKNRQCSLREMIEKGFDEMPRRKTDVSKKQEILARLDEADIGRIIVRFQPGNGGEDPYVELTNVIREGIADADARSVKTGSKDNIILYERYRMSDGNDVTRLKDAQRLTLIYSAGAGPEEGLPGGGESEARKEISLNITYIEG